MPLPNIARMFNKKKIIIRWHLNRNLRNTLNIAIEKLNLFFIKHKIGILQLNENIAKFQELSIKKN